MARSTSGSRAATGAGASDRPIAPRLPERLDVIDLSTISTGEWSRVELTGRLPPGFDEPLLLSEVRLCGAQLTGASIEHSRLIDVTIAGSDASGVDLRQASLTRVAIVDSRLSGGQLAECRMRDVDFTDSRLDGVNLSMASGHRVRFERCRLNAADLGAASFEGVAWWNCDLTDAEFSQVKLIRAQLHGSRLDGLRGARHLAPVSIDQDQFLAFATHVLDALGIVVTERAD